MRWAVASAVMILFLVPAKGHANLVVNPGFETGDFTGWITSGASFNCGNVISGISSNGPHSGAYSACFGNPDALSFISQTLTTVPGQEYELSFYYAQQPPGSTPDNEAQIFWDGVKVVDVSNIPVTPWSFAALLGTASSASTQLEFGFDNVPGHFALDDVSVDPVPEPQLVIPCCLALGLLGFLRGRAARIAGA